MIGSIPFTTIDSNDHGSSLLAIGRRSGLADVFRISASLLLFVVGPALFVWSFLPVAKTDHLLNNSHFPEQTLLILGCEAVFFCFGLTYTFLWMRKIRRATGLSSAEAFTRLVDRLASANHVCLGLVILPVIAAFRVPEFERVHPALTLLLVFLAATAVARTTYLLLTITSGALAKLLARVGQMAEMSRWVILLGVTGVAATLIADYTIFNHRALDQASKDSGIYHSVFWNIAQGNFLRTTLLKGDSHISAHFDPILLLGAPFYLAAPRLETILTLQSFLLMSGSIPLFLLARLVLESSPQALLLSLCYLCLPALHGAAMFEIHSLVALIPLALWALYFLEAQRAIGYAATLLLILFVREDMPLIVITFGLMRMALAENQRGRYGAIRDGLVTIGIAIFYLLIVKHLIMFDSSLLPAGGEQSYGYASRFSALKGEDGGAGAIALTLLTNPIFVLGVIAIPQKIEYLLLHFLPFLFLPWLAGPRILLFGYGLCFSLLPSYRLMYSIYTQYSALIVPFAAGLTPYGLRIASQRVASGHPESERNDEALRSAHVSALLAGILTATLLTSWKFGAFLPNSRFYTSHRPSLHHAPESVRAERLARFESLQRVISSIPPDGAVSASWTILPFVANRTNVFDFKFREIDRADYILADTNNTRDEAFSADLRTDPRWRELPSSDGFRLLERVEKLAR